MNARKGYRIAEIEKRERERIAVERAEQEAKVSSWQKLRRHVNHRFVLMVWRAGDLVVFIGGAVCRVGDGVKSIGTMLRDIP